MALITCPACKRDISPQAVACPQCGHPIADHAQRVEVIERGSGCGVTILGVLIIGLSLLIFINVVTDNDSSSSDDVPMPTSTASAAPAAAGTQATAKPLWQEVGKQGLMHFVVIDRAHKTNRTTYNQAFAAVCGAKPICIAHFWTESSRTPRSLPMTDAQAASQVATFEHNSNTGNHRLMLSCQVERGPDCF